MTGRRVLGGSSGKWRRRHGGATRKLRVVYRQRGQNKWDPERTDERKQEHREAQREVEAKQEAFEDVRMKTGKAVGDTG